MILRKFLHNINNCFYNALFYSAELLCMLDDRLGKNMGFYVDSGKQNFIFIFKIFIQCGSRDSGFFGDIGHGSLFKAKALEAL